MLPLGGKIRRARLLRGWSIDDLADRTAISKAYLSLIETGRLNNPPSDEKLQRLEVALGFAVNELVRQANVQRTPRDVRLVLQKLMRQRSGQATSTRQSDGGISLDDAYWSGLLQDFVGCAASELPDRSSQSRAVEEIEVLSSSSLWPRLAADGRSAVVPIVNRVSAGYPSDFTDLSYPPRNADAYITAPGLDDPDAFAARVSGDSMSPKYAQGDIVIFSPAAAWKDGADCFVRFEDGQTTFKRVYAEQDAGREMLRLDPRNTRYQATVVPREAVSGVYRAVSCYRRVEED